MIVGLLMILFGIVLGSLVLLNLRSDTAIGVVALQCILLGLLSGTLAFRPRTWAVVGCLMALVAGAFIALLVFRFSGGPFAWLVSIECLLLGSSLWFIGKSLYSLSGVRGFPGE